jgi:hypothetical protein
MRRTASLAEFAQFLLEAGEAECLDRKSLWNLYGEFCLASDTEPLTQPQLLRRARSAGIERYRLPTGRRQWRYRVRADALLATRAPGGPL